MITVKDAMEMPVYTGEFLKPNILVLRLVEYREGYVKKLVQMFTDLLAKDLPKNEVFHLIKVYGNGFYDTELITAADYDEARDELIYLKENWHRIYSVDVIPYETIGHNIDYEKNKEFIKDTTVTINVKH